MELILAELRRWGVLMMADPKLPSVTTLVAHEPVRGSWWGHPKSHEIFAVGEALEDHEDVLVCKLIAGKVTNLDPVTILVAVLAGGSVLGVYGMLLAIPAAACVKILISDVLMPRVTAWIKGEVKDPLPIDGA